MFERYVYWFSRQDFAVARKKLKVLGYRLGRIGLVPCKILRAADNKVLYAPPGAWSAFCYRQGSWYRESERKGQYVLVSEKQLPAMFDPHLEAHIRESDFMPATFPTGEEMEQLVASPCYQELKPQGWEKVRVHERIMLRVVFALTGFGKWRENFYTHWLPHRANHANFLCKKYTTELDGVQVPYSISENRSVCSPCAEFFNLVAKRDKKLVRACPGSIISGVAKRGLFYEVRPLSGQ